MKMLPGSRALDKVYKRRDRYEIPDWQRGKVWKRPRKQALIDSILRGWKLPKFYFLRTPGETEAWVVVDGQQRLMAIFEFFEGQFKLSAQSAERFGGKYYKDLPASVSDEFDDFEIEYDEIQDADEGDLKDFFQRLQRGLQLTSSEKLNAVDSNLTGFCRKLAAHDFLSQKTAVSNYRYGHFDTVSKVAAIEMEGIDAGLRLDDLKTLFESQANFAEDSNVAERLVQILDYLNAAFPEKEPALRNRTIVQSLATLTGKIIAGGKSSGYEQKLRAFFTQFLQELSRQVELGQEATDPDYATFQRTVSANLPTGARTRQEILLRKLLAYDPASTDLFGPTVISESGIEQSIRRQAQSISQLVAQANEVHASTQGIDLFKPTNKTAQAQARIGNPIKDYAGYRTLIDDLYFLFVESCGQRLATKPPSFADVNELRTYLDHDVDHGKPGKAAAKRKKLLTTFGRYAGGGTPETVAPARFPALQAALLDALEADLRQLLKQI